jgi:hypothetical protein
VCYFFNSWACMTGKIDKHMIIFIQQMEGHIRSSIMVYYSGNVLYIINIMYRVY